MCQHEAVLTRVVTRGYMEWQELGVVSSEGKVNNAEGIKGDMKAGAEVRRE